ncbi:MULTISPECIES: hypothetical protein [unclassified Rhizobium]|uniref:hypothetical protein n=1 Tax=unclassified Rhizobium TaxID=2613769 RepID=UPI0016120148|nr:MULTISPECIES: hypothetical protein [unclassified Rhizobium]MBB3545293.1 hypothetical protein [Rhizobium sp. BK399]MCS4096102.1 hypothetical protein [Rhizobium sp. BK176]
MSKDTIDIEQFSLAPRREPEANRTLVDAKRSVGAADNRRAPLTNTAKSLPPQATETLLPRLPEEERRGRAAKRGSEQQEAARRLKNLKRAKDRAVRFYVNVPLEQAVKERLMRAAHENDVKMTAILQAAIDIYLQDNGY